MSPSTRIVAGLVLAGGSWLLGRLSLASTGTSTMGVPFYAGLALLGWGLLAKR